MMPQFVMKFGLRCANFSKILFVYKSIANEAVLRKHQVFVPDSDNTNKIRAHVVNFSYI